jgi:Ca-activated chloride channel family protein
MNLSRPRLFSLRVLPLRVPTPAALCATLATAALALVALRGEPARAQAPEASFKIDVRLVRLLVTVKNAAGEMIGGLNREDFAIKDENVAQQIAVFERQTAQPLSVAVLVDISASTAKDLRVETTSISRFLRALVSEGNPKDAVSLYAFNDATTMLAPFTRRIAQIEDRLKMLKSESGTALYDAVYLSTRDLRDREGRHVIICVSDGGDTVSLKKYRDAIESLQRADTVMFPIVIVPISNPAGRNTGGEHALETLAASTGGRAYYATVGEDLDKTFGEILRNLRTQYLIGYYPRGVDADPGFHTVHVELPEKKDFKVSARSGYYADSGR